MKGELGQGTAPAAQQIPEHSEAPAESGEEPPPAPAAADAQPAEDGQA